MPTYEVWLTRRAQGDLNTARDYIARHAKETADRWYFSFLEALLDLEENPQGRPLAPSAFLGSDRLRLSGFRNRMLPRLS